MATESMRRPAARLALALLFLAAAADAAAQPPDATEMLQRVVQRLQAQLAGGGTPDFGPMSGMWRTGDIEGSDRVVVWQIGGSFIEYVIGRTGQLQPTGVAEFVNGAWRGWFAVHCVSCCPGVSWWDRGAVALSQDRRTIVEAIATKKMDPQRCVLTNVPDNLRLTMKAVQTMQFVPIAPGRFVYINGAPAVGNQPAQYKGLVRVRWDVRNLGASQVEVVAVGSGPGSRLLPRTTELAGQREFVTTRPGRYSFLLTAWNAQGQPLHLERIGIDIPGIGGINR